MKWNLVIVITSLALAGGALAKDGKKSKSSKSGSSKSRK